MIILFIFAYTLFIQYKANTIPKNEWLKILHRAKKITHSGITN